MNEKIDSNEITNEGVPNIRKSGIFCPTCKEELFIDYEQSLKTKENVMLCQKCNRITIVE